MTANEVAARLGVASQTVYAYASRGVLTKVTVDGRQSLYDAAQVEELAQRSRPRSARRRSGAVDVSIGTTISEIGDGWIAYRQRRVEELIADPFETVVGLLWAQDPGRLDAGTRASLTQRRTVMRRAAKAVAVLGADASMWQRLVVAVSSLPPDLDDQRSVFDALLAAVGSSSGALDRSIAERLWLATSPLAATRRRIAVLNRTLVALAEHELATSTLAVRVAASSGAPSSAAVVAGLATLSGNLHGGAPAVVNRALQAIEAGQAPSPTASNAGLGHPVHRNGDPRYELLMESVLSVCTSTQRRVIRQFESLEERVRDGRAPNIDTAVGALGYAMSAPIDTTEAIFAIARSAGWIAHSYEEADEAPLRFRGRTVFRHGSTAPDARGG